MTIIEGFDLTLAMKVLHCDKCYMPFALPFTVFENRELADITCPIGHLQTFTVEPVDPVDPTTDASNPKNWSHGVPGNPLADPHVTVDHLSFAKFCADHGHDPLTHYRTSQSTADLCPQPENDLVEVKPSHIHGMGVFTKTDVECGACAGMILDNTLHRTDKIGRYINHAENPNCEFVDLRDARDDSAEEGIQLLAIRDILPGDELTISYNTAADLKKHLAP